MKTLDLLNISTQVFIKVKIFIENEKTFYMRIMAILYGNV